jgi:demethylmenaquinone methyltransferase / 2-methoxy-6-polyprenyl-1,4-benzoquinol methylase
LGTNVTPYNNNDSKKNQVEDMFDNIAPKYDFLNRLLSLKIDVLWRKTLVNWLKKDQPKKILDVATGTGDLVIAVHQGTKAQMVGLDLSQQMLNVGIKKVADAGLTQQIDMIKGDAENLPFDTNSFDAVTVAFGVRNFENLNKGLAEMQRVLKPKASLYILEFSKPEGFFSPVYMFYFKKILPTIGKFFSKDPRAYTYLPDSVNSFPYGEEMRKILLNLNFTKVEYQKLTFGVATIYKVTK